MTKADLAGAGVLVTRPVAQADALVDAIEAAGGRAIRFPVVEIVAMDAHEIATLAAAGPEPDIVIFVSRNAVRFGQAVFAGCDPLVAAIGPATASALVALGITVDIVANEGFDSEHLLLHEKLQDVSGKTITIVRGAGGRQLLGDTLSARGADVRYLPVYERRLPSHDEATLAALEHSWSQGSVNCVTIMSVASLQNFVQLLPSSCGDYLRNTLLVAPGDRVIQTAKDLIPGIPTAQAYGPGAADMVATLIAYRQSGIHQ